MAGNKQILPAGGPIRFCKQDIIDAKDRMEYFLLDVKLFSAEVEGFCPKASGEEIDDVYLLKKSEEKKWARKSQVVLPPAVLKAASNSMLWDRPHAARSRRTGHVAGNQQSSLVA
ncbi:hypothetical protein LINPERHAP2_LOCUS3353 [Linum perenne]